MQPPSVALRVVLLAAIAVGADRHHRLSPVVPADPVGPAVRRPGQRQPPAHAWPCWRPAAPSSTATAPSWSTTGPASRSASGRWTCPPGSSTTSSSASPACCAMKPAEIRQEMVRQVGVPWSQIRQGLGLQYDFVTIKQDTEPASPSRTCSSTPSPTPASRCARTTCATIRWAISAPISSGSSARSAQQELTEARFRGYKAGDVVGQSGVEYTYDRWLRGVDGSVRVEVDASGRPKQVVPGGTLPQAGDNLQLSIDAQGAARRRERRELRHRPGPRQQRAARRRRRRGGARRAHRRGHRHGQRARRSTRRGSSAACRPSTGRSSTSQRRRCSTARSRAQYPMGSTFKVVDAVAALENGVHHAEHDHRLQPAPTRRRTRPAAGLALTGLPERPRPAST